MLEEYSMTRALLPSALLLTAHILVGCDGRPVTNAAPPAPPVTTASPLQKTITEWDEYTGRFAAVETVEVRARVSGFIDSVNFKEGQMVRQGDLLFVIDRRPYALAAEQVAASEAALKQAELNLEWSNVRAPTTGRISDRRVDAGNLITGGQSGATLLTVIVSIDPIHFLFDGSEADFVRYLRLAATGARPSSRDVQNPVSVKLADETDYIHQGQMDFVDNALNPKTGTIRGRAVFEHKNGLLTPGFFGRLRLFGGEHEALLIPDSAIASDQSRKIVFTVADDGTVGVKLIELGPIVDGLRVVRSG